MQNTTNNLNFTYDILNEALLKAAWGSAAPGLTLMGDKNAYKSVDKVEQMQKINQLLRMGADPGYRDKNSNNAFMVAFAKNNIEALKEFAAYGHDTDNHTCFILNTLREIYRFDPKTHEILSYTAPMIAKADINRNELAKHPEIEIVKEIEYEGRDVYEAAGQSNIDKIKSLISNGVSANTPMGIALFHCIEFSKYGAALEIFQFLVNNGAQIEPYEADLIDMCSKHENYEIMEFIIKYMGFNPDITYPEKIAPLVQEIRAIEEKQNLGRAINFSSAKTYSMDKILKI